MERIKDFLWYIRSIKSAMLIDMAGSLFVIISSSAMYYFGAHIGLVPILAFVGIRFVFSNFVVNSELKKFSQDLLKENITNFKSDIQQFKNYYLIKSLIFLIPIFVFVFSKIMSIDLIFCFYALMLTYLLFIIISLYNYIKIKIFIKDLENYSAN